MATLTQGHNDLKKNFRKHDNRSIKYHENATLHRVQKISESPSTQQRYGAIARVFHFKTHFQMYLFREHPVHVPVWTQGRSDKRQKSIPMWTGPIWPKVMDT